MQGFGNYSPLSEVPQYFAPLPNTFYRIVNSRETNKAFTVANDSFHTLTISNYQGQPNQKFQIIQQGNKYAFIVQSTQAALCIFQDNSQDGGKALVDPGKHLSSWFEIVRIPNGQFANKGYSINTFAYGKSLDLEGANSSNGTNVLQFGTHYGWNQSFLIIPADQPIQTTNNPYNQLGNNSNQGFSQGFNQGFNNQGFNNQGFNNQGFGQMQGIFKKNCTYALICSARESKCLQVQNRYLVIADYQGLPSQKYTFTFNAQQKKYLIRSVANGQYLNGAGFFAGVDIKTEDKGQEQNFGQSWQIIPSQKVGRGYNFKSFSSHTIDVPAGDYSNGKRVQKHGFHGGENQTFLAVEQ